MPNAQWSIFGFHRIWPVPGPERSGPRSRWGWPPAAFSQASAGTPVLAPISALRS